MPLYQLPNGHWRVQIRRKGLPTFDKVFPSQDEARSAHDRQLALPAQGFVPVELTLSELWSRYSGSVEFKQKTAHTQRTEATRVKPVLAVLGAYALKHLEAAPALIYDYIDQRSQAVSKRTGRVMSSTSVRLEIAALSAIAIWAKKRRYIAENFVRHISRPGRAERRRRIGAVEQSTIAETRHHPSPTVAQAGRFVRLLRLLGCRPGELAQLRCEDVDLDSGSVTFRRTKFKAQDRTVHVPSPAVTVVAEQIRYINDVAQRAPYLFPTRRKPEGSGGDAAVWGPFNYPWAIKLLRKHGVVAADFHAHAARREFVSRAIEDGVPYATIRKQTGHHSTAAIEIYDQGLATAPEVRQALERHSDTVSNDELKGLILNYGLRESVAATIVERVRGEKTSKRVVEHPVPLILQDPTTTTQSAVKPRRK